MLHVPCCDCGEEFPLPAGLRAEWRCRCPRCYLAKVKTVKASQVNVHDGRDTVAVHLSPPVMRVFRQWASESELSVSALVARMADIYVRESGLQL